MSTKTSTTEAFERAATQLVPSKNTKKKKRPAPLSIRVSDEERARLKREAAGGSVHGYVRDRLFGPAASKSIRVRRARIADDEALGRVLGALGRARLSSNLNQIAKAAHIGALPVTPELLAEIQAACAELRAMRQDLMTALGKRL